MFKITKDSVFKTIPTSLPNYKDDVIGELYEDMYLISSKNSNGIIKNHLVQTGNFYLREYYVDTQNSSVKYNDFMVDPEALIDITNIEDPIFVGCDLARDIDLTYMNGEYYESK